MTLSSHVYSIVLFTQVFIFYQNLVEGLWHEGLVHIFTDLYLIISILVLLQMLIVKKKKKNSRSSSSLLVYLLTPTYLLLILQSCLTQLQEPLNLWNFLHKQSYHLCIRIVLFLNFQFVYSSLSHFRHWLSVRC